MGEGSTIPTDPQHTPTILHPLTSQPQKTQTPRELTRMDTKIPQSIGPTEYVADEAIHKERGDSLVRAATTASSLEAEQDSGNITKTRSKARLNEPSSSGTSSGSDPRCQETIRDTIAQTRFENVSKLFNDPLLVRGITLVSTHFYVDTDMFRVHDLVGDEVVVESKVVVKASEKRNVIEEVVVVIDAASTIPVSAATITDVEITLAQALAELKNTKPKADKVVIQEPEQVKPMKRLEQIRLNEELSFKLQAKEEEEERLAREKVQQIKEANIAWDDVQAKVKADYQLAQRLQAHETELVEESSKKAETELEENLKKVEAKVMEDSSKRAGTELEQEVTKKQKVDDV
ncbi:hypothetical protein Tco_1090809 [Tanacetum coccineum]|uniref:Uncharacterized protein n=1 Tax=Tanacetum coccineum TaxID=301880 RepID=A0ABQ5I6D4_9ASTR